MRSVSFWGKFTSGSRIRASRSDLLKLPSLSIRATISSRVWSSLAGEPITVWWREGVRFPFTLLAEFFISPWTARPRWQPVPRLVSHAIRAHIFRKYVIIWLKKGSISAYCLRFVILLYRILCVFLTLFGKTMNFWKKYFMGWYRQDLIITAKALFVVIILPILVPTTDMKVDQLLTGPVLPGYPKIEVSVFP